MPILIVDILIALQVLLAHAIITNALAAWILMLITLLFSQTVMSWDKLYGYNSSLFTYLI